MPAVIAHDLFARRVCARLKQGRDGAPLSADAAIVQVGAQGPDLLYFHRVFPWQPGPSYARYGLRLHHISPRRLFDTCAAVMRGDPQMAAVGQSLVAGWLCHYALDRTVHPFVLYWQQVLQEEQPRYARRPNFYHYRIESALDTLTLRWESGRFVADFSLPRVLPPRDDRREAAIGRFLSLVLYRLFELPPDPGHAALAVGDMRLAMRCMNDPHQLRRRLVFRPLETAAMCGHVASSLLRPAMADDWDYANRARRIWHYPDDPERTSSQTYAELYEEAADEAVQMVRTFWATWRAGLPDLTGDRGFSSNLRGIYSETSEE